MKVVCVTGGAGSFGRAVVSQLFDLGATVRVLDNNEYSLYRLREKFHDKYGAKETEKRLRLFPGDICKKDRCQSAVEGVDTVIHAAALKHVWLGEADPFSFTDVNIDGTKNMVRATLDEKTVRTFMFVSTDKAVSPTNIYGQTKRMGEGLVLNANHIKGDRPTAFSVYRCGNFYGSSGSVIEKWTSQLEDEAPLTLVRGDFRRFFIGIYDAARLCLEACRLAEGGDLFVPRMKEYGMEELATLMSGNIQWIEPGPSEKLREDLMTPEEQARALEFTEMWVVKEQKVMDHV